MTIREGNNTRSQGTPIDEEHEAVITTPYFNDGGVQRQLGDVPLPVDIGGQINVQNLTVAFDSVQSTLNIPPGPLGANATFTGSWEDVTEFACISAAYITDQNSAVNGAKLQWSTDGVNVDFEMAGTVPANIGGASIVPVLAKYIRIVYTNGPVAQTVLRAEVTFHFGTMPPPISAIGTPATDLSIAQNVHAFLAGKKVSGLWDYIALNDVNGLRVSQDDFARILKFEPQAGEEIRRDETLTDDYHGVAPDGSATSSAVWKVTRFYKTAGLITRVRYRTGVAWDSRTAGW